VETIPDARLRLVFTACHPALSKPAQIALTLLRVPAAAALPFGRWLALPDALWAFPVS
jgi:RNA polymerase sigma-70 factor, ECF subfamily